jgi:hypothetical protein
VAEAEIVQLADGTVTLVPLPELQERQRSLGVAIEAARSQAAELGRQAGDRLAEAGRLLLARPSEWPAGTISPALLESAARLLEEVTRQEARIQEIARRPHGGLGGLVSRASDAVARGRLESAVSAASAKLRPLLLQLAQSAPPSTIPDADRLRQEAAELQRRAMEVTQSAHQQAAMKAAGDAELQRRLDASRQLGFDSLYTAAMLQVNGPAPVESPLILKRGEQAYMSVAATLARQRRRVSFEGSSQGFNFPIGHTGIRYRVGTFRGRPVSQEHLANIDNGQLVLSNQRVVFMGQQKSVSMALDKVLHVEAYTDGLAIFKEGRENADFLLFPTPQPFLMTLNYLLDHRG